MTRSCWPTSVLRGYTNGFLPFEFDKDESVTRIFKNKLSLSNTRLYCEKGAFIVQRLCI